MRVTWVKIISSYICSFNDYARRNGTLRSVVFIIILQRWIPLYLAWTDSFLPQMLGFLLHIEFSYWGKYLFKGSFFFAF